MEAGLRGRIMTHDPDMNAAHGGPVAPPEQRNWGPGGPRAKSELIERWTPSTSIGRRAYHKSFFPPGGLVTPWIRFKVMSTGVNVARRLWDQREELREAYEVEHGSDQDDWPHRHPGIVIDPVQWVAHAACLGCQWIDVRGHSMHHSDWFQRASIWPQRHQVSNGGFLDGPRRWRGGRFDPP
jgi:hypothetical protein